METPFIICKVWLQSIGGSEALCVMSPKLKTLQIFLESQAIDRLPKCEEDVWEAVWVRAESCIQERRNWERDKESELKALAGIRVKNWIHDLPEWSEFVKELQSRYPFTGKDQAWISLSIDEMKLLLKISNL